MTVYLEGIVFSMQMIMVISYLPIFSFLDVLTTLDYLLYLHGHVLTHHINIIFIYMATLYQLRNTQALLYMI